MGESEALALVAVNTVSAMRATTDGCAATRKIYALTLPRAVELAREYEPDLILLSSNLGGTRERSADRVPQLLRISPTSRLIMISPSPTRKERSEAISLGAFACMDYSDPGFVQELFRLTQIALSLGAPGDSTKRRRLSVH
jgi:DNA-binding NarL/FixJ family response regulator